MGKMVKTSLSPWVATAAYTVILGYFVIGLFLYLIQGSMIYYPTIKSTHAYPVTTYSNEGELIRVIELNAGREDAIIYFGGNAESVAYSAHEFKQAFPQHSVYLVNYRGYSGSSGSPSEKALYSDARHIYTQLQEKHPRIAVIGRSLGTGIAAELAATQDIHRLVLITPFDSARHVAQQLFPMYPMALLLRDQYDSLSKVSQIKAPTLILAAEHDQIIPPVHTRILARAFPAAQLEFHTIRDTSHNSISNTRQYYPLMQAFLSPPSNPATE